MKDKRHIKSFNEASENLNISDVISRLKSIRRFNLAHYRADEYIFGRQDNHSIDGTAQIYVPVQTGVHSHTSPSG